MKSFRLLHLSQTDIRYDNRILKELSSLAVSTEYYVRGIGVASPEANHYSKKKQNFEIDTLRSFTDCMKILPRPVRYAFVMTELTIRLTAKGARFKPNVVHCHDTMALPAGLLIKLLTGAKLIYDAHELESSKGGQSAVLSKATLTFERLCWRSVDYLISVSPSIINWYKDNLGFKPSSIILNSPIIEDDVNGQLPQVDNQGGYFHQLYDIPRDRKIFIYVGLLTSGRNIETAINAFLSGKISSHLIFVGYGKMRTEIAEIATKCQNIHLHGPVPHEEIVGLIRNADVGLCLIEKSSLSDYYCLPNKLFEYCFAGLPVIASRFPDIENIVEGYGLGFCCENETNSIIKAIMKFEHDNPGRINTDLFPLSWEAQEIELTKIYQTLLSLTISKDKTAELL